MDDMKLFFWFTEETPVSDVDGGAKEFTHENILNILKKQQTGKVL